MEYFLLSLKKLSNEYLNYSINDFADNHCLEFLNEISSICENLDNGFSLSVEALKEIMNKFGYNDCFYDHIVDIKNNFSSLSVLELFTLLYYCSCRNPLTFDNEFYILSIKNGCITSILTEISKKII